ncbi:MAG: alkaline phosphatase D family protein [Parvibaculaceae bacterium]
MLTRIDRRTFLKGFTALAGCFAATAGAPVASAFAAVLPVNAQRFPQGLASGDPQPDAVMLWTRAVPDMPATGVDLVCQVAESESFDTLILEKPITVGAESDFTARVFVQGLKPDTRYFYRFVANGETGPHVGRTRTAPAPDAERPVRFAFASCQNYERGFYGAWARLVADDAAAPDNEQLDFVLFLGDFIYEVIRDVPEGVEATRSIAPFPDGSAPWVPDGTRPWWSAGATWAVTVDDYRHLYKTYLSDPDLQAARARFPFVSTWDDHEFTNDSWQSHDTYFSPGKPAQRRKVAANQAWFEFIPAVLTEAASVAGIPNEASDFRPANVADTDYGDYDDSFFNTNPDNRAALGSLTIYRTLSWGKMLDLVVTDLRSYRSPPVVSEEVRQLLGGGTRLVPVRLVKELDAGRTAHEGNPLEKLTFEDREIANPRAEAPAGTCMGARQKRWFKETLKASTAQWRIWANSIPALSLRLNLSKVPSASMEDSYLGTDAWQGFPSELGELMTFVKENGISNVISCSGDYHTHAAGRLAIDPDADEPDFAAVDFATTSISSGNFFSGAESSTGKDDPFRPFVAYESGGKLVENFNNTVMNGMLCGLATSYMGPWVGGLLATDKASPGLDFLDSNAHGFGIATVEATGTTMTLVNVGSVKEKPGPDGQPVLRRTTFRVPNWEGGAAPVLEGPDFDGEPSFPFA